MQASRAEALIGSWSRWTPFLIRSSFDSFERRWRLAETVNRKLNVLLFALRHFYEYAVTRQLRKNPTSQKPTSFLGVLTMVTSTGCRYYLQVSRVGVGSDGGDVFR